MPILWSRVSGFTACEIGVGDLAFELESDPWVTLADLVHE